MELVLIHILREMIPPARYGRNPISFLHGQLRRNTYCLNPNATASSVPEEMGGKILSVNPNIDYNILLPGNLADENLCGSTTISIN